MERLTEKNDVGSYYFPKCFEKCNGLGASSKCDNCENMTNACEKLGAYEDAEERGFLLRLPCKVGDAVYQITNGFISEYEITSAVIYPYNILFKWVCTKGIYKDLLGFKDFEIGKTVFLTREEAEAKLKEMEEKDV